MSPNIESPSQKLVRSAGFKIGAAVAGGAVLLGLLVYMNKESKPDADQEVQFSWGGGAGPAMPGPKPVAGQSMLLQRDGMTQGAQAAPGSGLSAAEAEQRVLGERAQKRQPAGPGTEGEDTREALKNKDAPQGGGTVPGNLGAMLAGAGKGGAAAGQAKPGLERMQAFGGSDFASGRPGGGGNSSAAQPFMSGAQGAPSGRSGAAGAGGATGYAAGGAGAGAARELSGDRVFARRFTAGAETPAQTGQVNRYGGGIAQPGGLNAPGGAGQAGTNYTQAGQAGLAGAGNAGGGAGAGGNALGGGNDNAGGGVGVGGGNDNGGGGTGGGGGNGGADMPPAKSKDITTQANTHKKEGNTYRAQVAVKIVAEENKLLPAFKNGVTTSLNTLKALDKQVTKEVKAYPEAQAAFDKLHEILQGKATADASGNAMGNFIGRLKDSQKNLTAGMKDIAKLPTQCVFPKGKVDYRTVSVKAHETLDGAITRALNVRNECIEASNLVVEELSGVEATIAATNSKKAAGFHKVAQDIKKDLAKAASAIPVIAKATKKLKKDTAKAATTLSKAADKERAAIDKLWKTINANYRSYPDVEDRNQMMFEMQKSVDNSQQTVNDLADVDKGVSEPLSGFVLAGGDAAQSLVSLCNSMGSLQNLAKEAKQREKAQK